MTSPGPFAWSIPRRDWGGFGAFTPEYNPYGLVGPASDVFAIAVILYELTARVPPFVFDSRPLAPFAATRSSPVTVDVGRLDLPPSVTRGRARPTAADPTQWEILTTFVDDIVGSTPDELPSWAFNHRQAFERLSGRGGG